MSSDLYGERIKELAGAGSHRLHDADASARLDNPLCGDTIVVDVMMADGKVAEVGHGVKGCLLCKAAAAIASHQAPGMDHAAATRMLEQVSALLKSRAGPEFPDLAVFVPVRPHKSRHDCVLLPFKALVKAIPAA
ncbi:MAG: iron-sulfur cluster assembly scaffold protein [Magnetospirillum sp.]|nr:iron-sulfur cluster assembly scaffold protein [Magnetospirillum sp.]